MELLDEYLEIQSDIYDYFGYRRDALAIDDCREYFWREADSDILFAESERELESGDGQCFSVYARDRLFRAADFTMAKVNGQDGGGDYLMILDNSKERPNAH